MSYIFIDIRANCKEPSPDLFLQSTVSFNSRKRNTKKKIVEKVNLLLVIFRVEFFTQIMNLVGIAFILEIVVDGPLF
jgi:hypothetical protein